MTARSGSDDAVKRQRQAFAALPFAQRRAVVRAVSRGRAVENRKLAVHAVVVARRQQRLWRWLWITGPLIGLTQFPLGWEGVLVAGAVSTAVMAVLARFWLVRAQRAEAANLELVPKRTRAQLQPKPPRPGG